MDYPSEEFPVLHTMDGRRIVGRRSTWADYGTADLELTYPGTPYRRVASAKFETGETQ